MNSKLFKSLFVCAGALMLVSCWETDEDKLEVFMQGGSNSAVNADYKTIQKCNNFIDETFSRLNNNESNPDKTVPQSLLPDGFEQALTGYGSMGYVDLGLSHKWAVNNIGYGGSSDNGKVKTIDEWLDISFQRYELPTIDDDGEGVTVSYADYVKNQGASTDNNPITIDAEAYEAEAKVYCKNILNNIDNYISYLWTQKYGFLWNYTSDGFSYSSFDIATSAWGEKWVTPSKDEIEEIKRCELKEAKFKTVSGKQVTGPNGKSIFLPYTHMYKSTTPIGIYMTSNDPGDDGRAYCLVIVYGSDEPIFTYFPSNSYVIRPILK